MTFDEVEQELRVYAPQLAPARQAVTQAAQDVAAARNAVQQAREEYNLYAGMDSAGMTEEQKYKQQRVMSWLAEQASIAEEQLSLAENALAGARQRLDALVSKLRKIAMDFESVKSTLYEEMGKLKTSLDKLAALSGNRFARHDEVQREAMEAFNARRIQYNNCNIRIQQINQALANGGGDSDDDDDRDPRQNKLVKGRSR